MGEYSVRLFEDFTLVEPLWIPLARDAGAASTPFQDARWLSLWYRTFCNGGDHTPVIAVITEGESTGAQIDPASVAMILPLVRRTRYLLPVVEFADRGVTDYNMPLLGPRSPASPVAMTALFRALSTALKPYALLRLRKMPALIDGEANPFALLSGASAETLQAYELRLADSRGDFIRHLGKKKRSDIQRIWRAMTRMGPTTFSIANDKKARNEVFDVIRCAQRQRVPQKGDRYFLEDEGYRQFYEALIDDPEFDGLVVVSGIWVDGAPVAGLLGLRHGNRYIGLRIGQRDDQGFARLGLGRVLFAKTAQWAIDEGLEVFDFSLGDSAVKAWFYPSPLALIRVTSQLNGLLPPLRSGRELGASQRGSSPVPLPE